LLVCLTFGDRLFVECQEDQGGYHPEHMKKAIATELKVTFLNNTLTIMLQYVCVYFTFANFVSACSIAVKGL